MKNIVSNMSTYGLYTIIPYFPKEHLTTFTGRLMKMMTSFFSECKGMDFPERLTMMSGYLRKIVPGSSEKWEHQ